MRAIVIPMARWFPPRRIADRILPWITLLLATFGVGWTLFQYSSGVNVQRAETTLSIHRQFLETFPAGAQGFTLIPDEDVAVLIFEIRCAHYAEAVDRGVMPDIPALPDCNTITLSDQALLDELGASSPSSVRDAVRKDTQEIRVHDAPAARRMMTFLRSLQVCVQSNQCAEDITTELFAGDIVAFLDASCNLANTDPEFERQGRMLGQFARGLLPDGVIPWNTDPNRKDLLMCEHLRLETM